MRDGAFLVLGACQRRPLHDHRVPHHIADDDAKVSFESDHVAIDGKTGKPVADVTRYTYHDADTSIVVSFERQKTILQAILTDRAPLLKRIIAQLIGFDGAYHRFDSGDGRDGGMGFAIEVDGRLKPGSRRRRG